MPTAVSCDRLVHQYGDRKALDGVGFEVPQGGLFGLVGPNGGGKSTTFQILSTLLRPASGSVSILGIDALTHPEKVRRKLGVIFQSPALDKKLTVGENLRYQGSLYGMSGTSLESAVDGLLAEFGIADRKRDRVETLSGGLKRRVEIAKGLLHGPQVLILDEPTTALDPLARRQVWDHLTKLVREKGLTVLVTTHLLDEAEQCDSVAFLDKGKLVAVGAPGDLRGKVGAELITLKTGAAVELSSEIRSKFGLENRVVDNEVRIARDTGTELIGELLSSFRDRIDTLTVGKPTLEDFFISVTGRRYEEAAP